MRKVDPGPLGATRLSDLGRFEIARHEGLVLSPYYDTEGVLTVGLGHTANAGGLDPADLPMGGNFDEQARTDMLIDLFVDDLAYFRQRVLTAVSVPLYAHELDALTSFDYNTGGIFRARLTEYLNAGKREEAADAFMGWLKPESIIGRRVAEQRLFRSATYKGGSIAVYTADEKGNRSKAPCGSISFQEFERMVNNVRPDAEDGGGAGWNLPDVGPSPPRSGGLAAAAAAAVAAILATVAAFACDLPVISSFCGG